MIRLTATLSLTISLLLTVPPVQAQEAAEIDAARSLWRAAAVADYRFSYRKFCECKRDAPPLTVVSVSAGRVSAVHHLHDDSEREVPAREGSLDLYWTIDELFDKLDTAIAAGATVRARFDSAAGFPSSLFIDYDPDFAGDETDLRGISFERL